MTAVAPDSGASRRVGGPSYLSGPSAATATATSPAQGRVGSRRWETEPRLRALGASADEPRTRRLVRVIAAVAVSVAAACIFAVVVAHVVLTQNQFRLDALQTRSSAGQAEYDRLRLEVAKLESPDRIVATAQQRLGMVAPPRITYLTPSAVALPKVAAPAVAPPTGDDPTAPGGASSDSGWSTVKPHLAGG